VGEDDVAETTIREVAVPDFRGQQALDAWLRGHDLGLACQGTNPDSPEPLLHGRVVDQSPPPGTILPRWDVVTLVVVRPGEAAGMREPRRPLPPDRVLRGEKPLPPE
jgi:beta-lactam-binding protein with PASTA domain